MDISDVHKIISFCFIKLEKCLTNTTDVNCFSLGFILAFKQRFENEIGNT